ncbi:MAG: peptide deformylase [Candidatus Pacebacteria bacterium]|nr:peptide deformylase [Candidatus Paceibacterota bacterium]MDD5356615.1 peptide deformylase [Candidatus Paceibacterota bacterium]
MRKSKILQVAQLGNAVIRQKAKAVKNVHDPEIQELIENMIATCKDSNGVGIAAPQVYEPLRIFIIWSHPNSRYPKAPKMKPIAMINPRILKKSHKMKKDWEGCLSVPGIRALVPRSISVEVEYTDRKGKVEKKKLSHNFVARIFQHELDHLNGIVFLDRARSKDILTEKEYQLLMKKK